tara:strand:- start:2862 stop:3095 length:234 start_codon:yes stop_codon:yes gene_type:complete
MSRSKNKSSKSRAAEIVKKTAKYIASGPIFGPSLFVADRMKANRQKKEIEKIMMKPRKDSPLKIRKIKSKLKKIKNF